MSELDSNLIRAYVDGELPADAEERVRAHLAAHPEERARIELETKLKAAVGRSMASSPTAPAALSASIRRVVEQERPAEEAAVVHGMVRSTPEPVGGRRTPWGRLIAAAQLVQTRLAEEITRPRKPSPVAVVAVLVIVAAAVLVGIFVPQIDTFSPNQRTDLAVDASEYVADEHARCARNPDWRRRNVNRCSPQEAAEVLGRYFGVDNVTVFNLSEVGYEFVGEGRRCGVPGTARSAHLFYERHIEGRSPAKLSIFIGTAGPERPKRRCGSSLRPGEWYCSLEGGSCESSRKRVLLSTDSSLVYYLVACDPADSDGVAEYLAAAIASRSR